MPRLFLFVLLLCAGVLFVGLTSPYGLHQNDEDVYLAVASNMLDSGDWVVPYWSGQPTFTKPPLLYWMMAASLGVLGPTLFAARLPVALLSLLTVAVTFLIGRRLLASDLRAALAALLTGTTIGALQFGRVAMMEMPLCFFYLCAMWAVWRIGQGSGAACYGFALAAAGSVLLKGPAAALVPMLGATVWLAVGRRGAEPVRALAWRHVGGAVVLFVAVVGAWLLAVHLRGLSGALYTEFVVGENLGKFVGERGPVMAMLVGYSALLVPWTLLLLGALFTWARGGAAVSVAAARLCAVFVAANLAFYCLPAVKWARYLLPSSPLLALLLVNVGLTRATRATDAAFDDDGSAVPTTIFSPIAVTRPVKGGAVITGLVFLAVVPFLAFGARLFTDTYTRVEILVLALALAGCALCLLHGTRLLGAAACFAVALMAIAALAPALTFDRPPPEITPLARGMDVVTYAIPPYRYEVLMGRKVGTLRLPGEVRAFARAGGGAVIVGTTELRELMDAGAFDPSKAEMLVSWTKWRRGMNPFLIGKTILGGKLDDLTETMWMMRLR